MDLQIGQVEGSQGSGGDGAGAEGGSAGGFAGKGPETLAPTGTFLVYRDPPPPSAGGERTWDGRLPGRRRKHDSEGRFSEAVALRETPGVRAL